MALTPQEQKVFDDLLIEAVRGRDLAHVRLYIAKGANVHVMVPEVRETIIINGSAKSGYGPAPLYHLLCAEFSPEISDVLLEHGVDVDVKNFNGNTPLMLAVRNVNETNIDYFLNHGANPLATNNSGEIVLDMARRLDENSWGRQDIIDALVKKLPDVTASTEPKKETGDMALAEDLKVSRPVTIVPKKKTGGLHL